MGVFMKTTYYDIELGVNLKIAHLSDIHGKVRRRILDVLRNEKPDLIAISGDLYDGNLCAKKKITDFLTSLVAIAPTFYSLGNHEIGMSEETRRKITDTGVHLLDDSFESFRGVTVGGLTSGFFHAHIGNGKKNPHLFGSPAPSTAFLDRFASLDGCKILLSHHPEYYFDYIKDRNVDLTLSGHAHGGQIRLFGRGLIAPGQGFFPKYTSGVHDGRLVISRGLANTARLIPRFFNETEIVILKIGSNLLTKEAQ